MIAISLTVHEMPHVVMELMSNIRYTYNGNAFLVVHVSRDNKEKFLKHAAATGVDMHDPDVHWNDVEMPTKWGNTLPMQVSNFLYLTMTLRRPFTHFQILSPANLVVGTDMDRYVASHDILLNNTIPTAKGWRWHEQVQQDTGFTAFREAHGLGDPVAVRVDGMAVRADIFGGFVRRLLDIYSLDAMRNLPAFYPQEETIIPTYLSRFRQFAYKFAPSRSRTFEPHHPPLTIERVEKIMEEGKIAYLKRIPPHRASPLRRFILERRSLGVGGLPRPYPQPAEAPAMVAPADENDSLAIGGPAEPAAPVEQLPPVA
ncbi:hypothetical protein [Siccirubricoccus phaeus]|uniref:hypothetical protein n=1 Tax=Siccirubricoccus phaeus TaxID=2595053 RepID=UPI0011F226C5|nr:hypothetical protein [Siccirubricoccus phaeus]